MNVDLNQIIPAKNNLDKSTLELIQQNFEQSIETKQAAKVTMSKSILMAVNLIVEMFNNGNKILICGNGGSAADAQHFAAEFTGRYEIERRPLPAIALTTDTSAITAIGNDYGFEVVFSKQIEALGKSGDILFAISTSGNSKNILAAIKAAKKLGMHIITLSSGDGGAMARLLSLENINNVNNINENKVSEAITPGGNISLVRNISLCVPATRTARIQEVHLLVLHTICDAVDRIMFN